MNILLIPEVNDEGYFLTSSGKKRLMEGQQIQVLIRRRAFCVASDQSLQFCSHNEHLQKTLFLLSAQFKKTYDHEQMEKADIGKHCFLLNKLDFLS